MVRRIGNTKAKGSRRERAIRDKAFDAGAVDVVKSGASLGPFDLVLIFPARAALVQVKSNAWPGRVESGALDVLAGELDSRLYRVITVRVDDGRGGKPVAYRVRIHNGPAVPRDECSWDEFIGALPAADAPRLVPGTAAR